MENEQASERVHVADMIHEAVRVVGSSIGGVERRKRSGGSTRSDKGAGATS